MRILILGGTVFLSYTLAQHAVGRGWEVTCVARGDGIPEGARHVRIDRSVETDAGSPAWRELANEPWDAVIDVARIPSWVRTAVQALGAAARHWTFVSTINVYADLSVAGASDSAPTVEPTGGIDLDDRDPTAYGRNKVECENDVRAHLGDRAFIVRPGLIAGPGDPTGRFTYWPVRFAQGGRALVPAPSSDPMQVIDVRDLADGILDAAETRRSGVTDAVGRSLPRAEFFAQVAAGVGGDEVTLEWVAEADLLAADVTPWSGPRSLPLWLPRTVAPEMAAIMARDEGGRRLFSIRPLAETARDTLAWQRATPDAAVTGLTRDEESALLPT